MNESPRAFAERGKHPVGVTTVKIADAEHAGRVLETDIWYPAAEGAAEAAHPAASHPLNRPHHALESPPAAPGTFPLIAFSHGNSGLRRQSTFLTTHLASWGHVVVAPDHTGNTFFEMLAIESEDERKRVHLDARRNRPRDLSAALDVALAGEGPWARIEETAIGALGHSYGGWTSMKMPRRDSRVRAVCGLAPASEPFVGRKAFDPGELPFADEIPVLIVAGEDDVLVDLETSVRPLFDRMGAPGLLLGVADTDHFHFCDGVELLHGLHERNPRERQPRPTRPYNEQLSEERIHRILQSVVTRFFREAFGGEARESLDGWSPRLAEVDPAVRLLDSRGRPAADRASGHRGRG